MRQEIPVATKNYQELPRAIWTTKSGLELQRGARSCQELPGAARRYQELPRTARSCHVLLLGSEAFTQPKIKRPWQAAKSCFRITKS